MTIHSFQTAADRGSSRWSCLVAALVALALVANAVAQAPAARGGTALPPSDEALDMLVGPIALYPDDLIAIILPASTNPLQLVQADRYLGKRKADPKLPLDDKWDDSVKSLLNYPDVVKSMSSDLDWTSALGEAVVADQGAVLDAIQVFRRKTQAAGNLKSDAKQVVVVEKEIIKIVPADPQVIYVPQYNPTTVVVYSAAPVYGYYPTPYPSYYYPYPPGAAVAAGVIWGAAIGAAWSGNHYGASYGGSANININNTTNINTANVNKANINSANVNSANVNRASASAQSAGGSAQWKSNKQPGQVSGLVGKTASAQVGAVSSAQAAGGAARTSTQAAGGAAAARSPTQAAGGAAAARPSTQSAGSSAFGGASASGRQTQMDSSRGASSRSSMSGGGMASAGAGGGARGGGGGGGGGGRGGRR